jgi:hypothetical protein
MIPHPILKKGIAMFEMQLVANNGRKIKLIRAALESRYGYVKASQRPMLIEQIENLDAANAILLGV